VTVSCHHYGTILLWHTYTFQQFVVTWLIVAGVYFDGSIRKRRRNLDSEQRNLHSGNTSDPVDTLSKMQDQKGEPQHYHCFFLNFVKTVSTFIEHTRLKQWHRRVSIKRGTPLASIMKKGWCQATDSWQCFVFPLVFWNVARVPGTPFSPLFLFQNRPHNAPCWVIEPSQWLLLELGMLFHRLFILHHHCCSSTVTWRRHCFSHHTPP